MPWLLALNPYVGLAIVLVLTLSHTSAYLWGHRNATKTCTIEKAELTAESSARREAELGKAIIAATTLEARHAATRTEFRTITRTVDRVVDRPIYRNVCLDDDGLRAANAALTGARSAAPEPVDPLPGLVHP